METTDKDKGKSRSFKYLISVMGEDIKFYCGTEKFVLRAFVRKIVLNGSLQLVLLYRLSHFLYLRQKLGMALAIEWVENILFGCLIAFEAEIGRRFRIAHPMGIVIGLAKIHDNVTIWQNVTIGGSGNKEEKSRWPTIESNVRIFANAVVVGGIRVGEGSTIGATAFVNYDIQPNSLVLAPRAVVKEVSIEEN